MINICTVTLTCGDKYLQIDQFPYSTNEFHNKYIWSWSVSIDLLDPNLTSQSCFSIKSIVLLVNLTLNCPLKFHKQIA